MPRTHHCTFATQVSSNSFNNNMLADMANCVLLPRGTLQVLLRL